MVGIERVCVCVYLILHHGPLLCRPAVVRVMWHSGGAAKVTQLDGALVTNQEVLNLRQEKQRVDQEHFKYELAIQQSQCFMVRQLLNASFTQRGNNGPWGLGVWSEASVCACAARRDTSGRGFSAQCHMTAGPSAPPAWWSPPADLRGRKRNKEMTEKPSVRVKEAPARTNVPFFLSDDWRPSGKNQDIMRQCSEKTDFMPHRSWLYNQRADNLQEKKNYWMNTRSVVNDQSGWAERKCSRKWCRHRQETFSSVLFSSSSLEMVVVAMTKIYCNVVWWMSKYSGQKKRKPRKRHRWSNSECHKPLHNSVRIRNSACPVSDSSLLMDAAEQNWTMLGWPDSFFCRAARVKERTARTQTVGSRPASAESGS